MLEKSGVHCIGDDISCFPPNQVWPRRGFQPDSSVDDNHPLCLGSGMTLGNASEAVRDRLTARLDHVAVAVPSSEPALARWRDQLGAGFAGGTRRDGFMTSQWRYRNGGKLELIEPDPNYPPEEVYLTGFLAKYGASIHHLTLKVPNLEQPLDALRRAGIEPIGINREPLFHEAFVRPRDGGGLLIQLLWTNVADHEWENDLHWEVTPPPVDGARLLAARLRHPDLSQAAWLWTILGAQVVWEDSGLVARWPESFMEVRIEPGQPAGPVDLVFGDASSRPAHPRIGPAIERQVGPGPT